MSQSKDRHEAERWLQTAAEDLRAAQTLRADGLPDLTPGESYFLRDANQAIEQAVFFLEACRRFLP